MSSLSGYWDFLMTRESLSTLSEIADNAAELEQLRSSAHDVLDRAWSVERCRKLLDGPSPAFDRDLWLTIAELGWPDVLVSEANGGGGGNLHELSVLAEVSGAAAVPVPLAATAAAGWCEDRCSDGISLLLETAATLTGEEVSGTWPLVPYGMVATRLLTLADDDGSTVLGVVDPTGPGVQRELLCPLDRSPAARITLQAAPIHVISTGKEAARRHRDAILRAHVAQVAELVGIASAANDAATEYAKVRIAFGRPIGSFQAIKHRLVDQRTAIEVGRALANRAADACEHDHPERDTLASLAAFWAVDSLRAIPEGATQVFGGIAYTWEHEAHVHLRRAACAAAMLGPRARHREVVTKWLAGK